MRVDFQGNGFRAEITNNNHNQLPTPGETAAILRFLKNGSLLSFFSFPIALGSLIYFLALSLGKGLMLENLPPQVFIAYVIGNLAVGLLATAILIVSLVLLRKRGGDLSVMMRRICYVLVIVGLVFAGIAIIGAVLHIVLL